MCSSLPDFKLVFRTSPKFVSHTFPKLVLHKLVFCTLSSVPSPSTSLYSIPSSGQDSDTNYESSENFSSESEPDIVLPTPSVQSGTTTNSPEDDIELDECLFEPIYENASITVSGAFCAIMELKRKCRLPFTTIQKLLDLLQLLCPPNNKLPQSNHILKTFFKKLSIPLKRRRATCDTEFQADQTCCSSCVQKEPNTLITLNSKRAITRVLKIKVSVIICMYVRTVQEPHLSKLDGQFGYVKQMDVIFLMHSKKY